jgi:hypothetical protein
MADEQRLEEQEKLNTDDDDFEAHRRRLAEEPNDTEKSDDGDDVEAHRRR